MKTWCIKDYSTGHIFKTFMSEQEFQEFLRQNPDMDECINCVECEDAPSITLE